MRLKHLIAAAALLASTALLPVAAHAYHSSTYTITNVSVRTGPGKYPIIARLRAGTPVSVDGCLPSWQWCAISAGGVHGWAAANLLGGDYHGRRAEVMSFGPRWGIPVMSFNQRNYWTQYYSDQDFYRQAYGRHEEHREDNRHQWDHDHDHDARWHHDHDGDRGHDHAATTPAPAVQPAPATTTEEHHHHHDGDHDSNIQWNDNHDGDHDHDHWPSSN